MATKRSNGASGNDEKRTKKQTKPAENPKGSASVKPKAAAKSSTAKASTKKASTAKAESMRSGPSSKRRTTSASSAAASASKSSAKPARESKVACECSSHKAEAGPAPAQSRQSESGHDLPARKPEPVRRAAKKPDTPRMMAVVALIAVAFIASYNFASAANGAGAGAGGGSALAAIGADAAALAGGAGGGCCGGGGAPIEKQTDVQGDVQTIAVDTSSGSYDPNVIVAKAGVPIEIDFSQSSGCLYAVQFPDFGVYEDLQEGPKTIKLPALEPGEYQWACGMNMATGTLRVE